MNKSPFDMSHEELKRQVEIIEVGKKCQIKDTYRP